MLSLSVHLDQHCQICLELNFTTFILHYSIGIPLCLSLTAIFKILGGLWLSRSFYIINTVPEKGVWIEMHQL